MAVTIFTVLTDEINKAKTNREASLVNGSAADFAEYKRLAGEIRGLTLAEEIINDLAKRQLEDDDDI